MAQNVDKMIGQYINMETGAIQEQGQDSHGGGAGSQHFTIEDAATISARTLVPQLGSDKAMLAKGKVDVRRFSNICEIDVIWLTWFMNIPKQNGGDYASLYCENYLNLRYSVGGENKRLVVDMQKAISGLQEIDAPPKKKGILERLGLRKSEDNR